MENYRVRGGACNLKFPGILRNHNNRVGKKLQRWRITMFNKIRLKQVLAEYKKVFVQQQWPNEKYKWEAVQCFQENWDINSPDFAQMLKKSLD